MYDACVVEWVGEWVSGTCPFHMSPVSNPLPSYLGDLRERVIHTAGSEWCTPPYFTRSSIAEEADLSTIWTIKNNLVVYLVRLTGWLAPTGTRTWSHDLDTGLGTQYSLRRDGGNPVDSAQRSLRGRLSFNAAIDSWHGCRQITLDICFPKMIRNPLEGS